MDTRELKELAVESSEKYYEYLRLYSKGLEKINVDKVEFVDNFVSLHMETAAAFSEKVGIEICGVPYDNSEIKIVQFDREENTVLVMPKINLKPLFYQVEPSSIKVVADLKITVKKVWDWYENLQGTLELPHKAPKPDFDLVYGSNLTDDQKSMVDGVFDNPFTCIWGEQNTAKTFAVLADCIMNYVRNGKKIIVTAPTDNALDRTLTYILEIMKREGLPLKKVLRLGMPTKKFAKHYNEACELSGIEKMVSGMSTRIKDLEEAYEFFLYSDKYNKMKSEVPEIFQKLGAVYIYKKELSQTLEVTDAEWNDLNGQRQLLNDEIKDLNRRFIEVNDEILRYNGRRIKLFQKNRLEEAELLKTQIRRALDEKNKNIEDLDYKINLLSIRRDQLTKAYAGDNRDAMYVEDIKRLTEFDIEIFNVLKDLNSENYAERRQVLTKIIANYDTVMKQRERRFYMYKGMAPNEILKKINVMNSEKNNLIKMSTIERAKDVLIVAAPIDTYITRLAVADDVIADDACHIFMEDAGICPLIKGMALLQKHIPITFVGDSAQQEITCQMTYNEIMEKENISVVLWAQSVLHVEELMNYGFSYLLTSYMRERKAPYHSLVLLS